jgi:hypothetical protein
MLGIPLFKGLLLLWPLLAIVGHVLSAGLLTLSFSQVAAGALTWLHACLHMCRRASPAGFGCAGSSNDAASLPGGRGVPCCAWHVKCLDTSDEGSMLAVCGA